MDTVAQTKNKFAKMRHVWSDALCMPILQDMFPQLEKAEQSSGTGDNLQFDHSIEGLRMRVKLSFKPRKGVDNNHRVEAQIYEHVLTKIRDHVPHVPDWYGTVTTPFFFGKTNLTLKNEEDWDTREATALMIEFVDGEAFRDCVAGNPHLIFQVLYTLACFDRVGLRHNDLHTCNILVQTLPEEKEFRYEFSGTTVSFKSSRLVKIIDYDHSCIYHREVERNGMLDSMGCEGQYNGYHPCFWPNSSGMTTR